MTKGQPKNIREIQEPLNINLWCDPCVKQQVDLAILANLMFMIFRSPEEACR